METLIELPSLYGPTKDWQDFLAQMQQHPQRRASQNVQWAIQEAQQELARRQASRLS